MLPEIGHLALWLAAMLALAQTGCGFTAARHHSAALLLPRLTTAHFLCLLLAFFCLMGSYIQSDFSVLNVFQNSHTDKPLLYKISGTWGNHEGSMLLWVLVLALFGAALMNDRNAPEILRQRASGMQGLLGFCFLLFILLTSNPFARLLPAPLEGRDLNPLLQDPALAFHPPLLYVGYVGFSLTFSIAIAALLSLKANPDLPWARVLRPWALVAWAALTLGIALGSYWAYYELGWGGWWFWDPVENASLMPWLLGTALIHCISVVEKRGALRIWTLLLAILAFSLSLLGTFLVRSGVLTSVHAFALDPERGIFILLLLGIFTGGALLLFALRAPDLPSGPLFAPVSRESFLLLNNLILSVCTLTVLVGTLYPLLLETLTGEKISVGPPFYAATFVPLALPLLLLMCAGPLLRWRQDEISRILPKLRLAALAAVFAAALGLVIFERGPWIAFFGLFVGGGLVIASLTDLWRRAGKRWHHLLRVPVRYLAMSTAHLGLGICTLGMTGAAVWTQESMQILHPGETLTLGDYTLTFERLENFTGPNYVGDRAHLTLRADNAVITRLAPERRWYPVAEKNTTEVAIHTTPFYDLYAVLGDPAPAATAAAGGSGWTVRLFHHPLVPWIWAGALLMALGGAIGALDRSGRGRQHKVSAPPEAAGETP